MLPSLGCVIANNSGFCFTATVYRSPLNESEYHEVIIFEDRTAVRMCLMVPAVQNGDSSIAALNNVG